MPQRHRPNARFRSARAFAQTIAIATALLACQPETDRDAEASNAAADAGAQTRPEDGVRPLAPSGRPYSEDREACANRDREPTGALGRAPRPLLPLDGRLALGRPQRSRREPFVSRRASRPFSRRSTRAGSPTRAARLERPIDFAALTDHATFQGEVALCTRPGSVRYDSEPCRIFRGELSTSDDPLGSMGAPMSAISEALEGSAGLTRRKPELCGETGEVCRASMKTVWEEQQAAAERHYDRTASCRFTTLHAYEYTATPGLAKVHHNVIFRNARVPASPIAWVDEPDVYDLWDELRRAMPGGGERL